MPTEQHRRIMGYFIDEAKEHLQTIEQGILNLQVVLQESDRINEVFRAAHSLKGGAGMLGLGSIQKTAHRLEDYFKTLQEHVIQVDQVLESLFLQVFDALKALVDQLPTPDGLTDDVGQRIVADVEPVFDQLQNHLTALVQSAPTSAAQPSPQPSPHPDSAATIKPTNTVAIEDSALVLTFQSDVSRILREMLQLLKQPETIANRQEMIAICQNLGRLGEQFDLTAWSQLLQAATRAVMNRNNSYRDLAPVLIREIKQAQDWVLAGKTADITPSATLLQMAPEPVGADEIAGLGWLTSQDEAAVLDDITSTSASINVPLDMLELGAVNTSGSSSGSSSGLNSGSNLRSESDLDAELDVLGDVFAPDEETKDYPGPAVGIEELNSLADLFEGEGLDLGDALQLEEGHRTTATEFDQPLGGDDSENDVDDLLSDGDATSAMTTNPGSIDDFDSLFGDETLIEEEGLSSQPSSSVEDMFDPLEDLFSVEAQPPATEPLIVDSPLDDLGGMTDLDNLDNWLGEADLIADASDGDTVTNLELGTTDDLDLESLLSPVSEEPISDEPLLSLDNLELSAASTTSETDGSTDFLVEAASLPEWPDVSLAQPAPLDASLDTNVDDRLQPAALQAEQADSTASSIDDLEIASLLPSPPEAETDELSAMALEDLLTDSTADLELSSSEGAVLGGDDRPSEDLFTDALSDLLHQADSSPEPTDSDVWSALMAGDDTTANDFLEDLSLSAHSEAQGAEGLAINLDEIFTHAATGEADLFDDHLDLANSPNETIEPSTQDLDALMAESVTAEDDFLGIGADLRETVSSEAASAGLDTLMADPLADDDSFLEMEIGGLDQTETALGETGSGDLDSLMAETTTAEEDFLGIGFDAVEEDSPDAGPSDVVNDLDSLMAETTTAEEDFLGIGFDAVEEDSPDAGPSDVVNDLDSLMAETTTAEEDFLGIGFDAAAEDSPDAGPSDVVNDLDSLMAETTTAEEDFLGLDFDAVEEDSPDAGPSDLASDLDSLMADSLMGDTSDWPDRDLTTTASGAEDSETQAMDLDMLLASPAAEAGSTASEQAVVEIAAETIAIDFNIDDELNFVAAPPDFQTASPVREVTVADTDLNDLFAADLGGSLDDFSLEVTAPLETEIPARDALGLGAPSMDSVELDSLLADSDLGGIDLEPPTSLDSAAIDNSEDLDGLENLLESDELGADLDSHLTMTGHELADHELSDLEDLLEIGDLGEDGGEPLAGISASDDHSLDDLDSLLGSEPEEVGLSNDLSDLDALLKTSVPETTIPVGGDDFADLDSLLAGAAVTAVAATTTQPVKASASDDFSDLENLLLDADKQMGAPMVKSVAAQTTRPIARSKKASTDTTMRVPVRSLDTLTNLVGELVVNRNSLEQDQERLRQFLDNLLYQVQQLSDVGQRMRDLYERSLLESSLLASRQSYYASSNRNNSHATGADFDALEMDRFTAFHSLSQEMIELIVRVRESASDIEFIINEPLDQVTRNFRQVTTQLQEGLNRARMEPFSITADRLPRGVRDNAIKEGKEAELVVEGRETLIDKMIREQLNDPLIHLINNSIAHGIEKPEVRKAAGKPPVGRITLRVFHQGNQTVISVSDDGAGIDTERIKAKAIEKGFITFQEAQKMVRQDIYELLFLPGFSGADKVTDLSGRGVGMDVVRTTINEMRGTITIDSAVGKGTSFTIRLPLTLSISKALCCVSNRARIAFPMDGVEDMLDVPRERVQTNAEGMPCIPWRDMMLPFHPLADVLKYHRFIGRGSVYGASGDEDIISIVVLRSAGNFTALQVDQVMGEQEIVIKQLEGPVPKPDGIAGATVLGDGRIMPIADVLELIDLCTGRRDPSSHIIEPPAAVSEIPDKHEPTVLIVDDSITVRELLSMTFNKVGYRVEQARDGQDAWDKLRSGLPCDIVFCDIEMPRMDGLELLSRIQRDSNLNHLPIAMLTSRGADRHRQMAVQMGARGYFTKPYLEEALLDAAQRMLKGEILVTMP